ncbi:MAG: hypothetical protein WCP20_15700 [Desulfuromonadales bacterium]
MKLSTNKEIKRKKRIVLCGSMSFYPEMLTQAKILKESGIDTVVPISESPYHLSVSELSFQVFKRKASMKHIRKIRDNALTFGILVMNLDKHGIPNYIGPNTFAEIAVAVTHYKKIYLFQGMPAFYRDELVAWDVICLDGDLNRIIKDYWTAEEQINKQGLQLELFEGNTE